MKNVKAIAAATLTVSALGLTALAAPAAQAQVNPGRYTMASTGFGGERIIPATVRGNTLIAGAARYRLVSTRDGAFYNTPNGRVMLARAGKGTYSGTEYVHGFPYGLVILKPRR